MNRSDHEAIISRGIDDHLESLFPNGEGRVSSARVKHALEQVASVAFEQGRVYALSSLIPTAEAAEMLGVSVRRMQALAVNRHARFGIGYQVPGTRQWLFTPEEIEMLRDRSDGRPQKTKQGDGTTMQRTNNGLLIVKNAWTIPQLPSSIVIELPDGSLRFFNVLQAPHPPAPRDDDLRSYKGYDPRMMAKTTRIDDERLPVFGLSKG